MSFAPNAGSRVGRGRGLLSGVQREVPATGFAIRSRNDCDLMLLDPAAGLATGTIYLPAPANDGAQFIIAATKPIYALTVLGPLGQAITSPPGCIGIGARLQFLYIAATNTWACIDGGRYQSVAVMRTPGATVFNINSTSYVRITALSFVWDFDYFPITHFRVNPSGNSNQAGVNITLEMRQANTANTLHTGGNDVTLTNSAALYDSGWLTYDLQLTGYQEISVYAKGVNNTVDYSCIFFDVQFRAGS